MLNISWTLRLAVFALLGLVIPAESVFAQPPAEAPPAEAPMPEESPLLIEPTTPEDAFEAAALMQRLGRGGLARRYLTQFLDANPDDDLLLKIRDKEGPAVFLRLANDPALQPESKTLLEKVNAAFRKRGADPVRINKLIADLSGTSRERAVALQTLKSGGTAVVPQMLASLANADPNQKSVVIGALVQMGDQVVPPLLGALESANPDVRGAAIEVLGYLGSQSEVPFLWRPAFGPDEPPATSEAARNALTEMLKPEGQRNFQVSPFGAPAQLKRAALEHYRNEYNWPLGDEETAVTIWTWDEQNQTVAPVQMTPEQASLYRGAQLARDALALSPEDEEAQALFLGFALANEQHRIGFDAPLPTGPNTAYQLALGSGADVVSRTLTQAMQNGNAAASVAALQALSQIATRTQLYGTNAERSPILSALNYPDPRVQFAAAVTVLELSPDREFPGANRVVEILTKALGNSGAPSVLVIDPNPTRANDVAGLLQQMGFRGQPITRLTGQDGFNAAIERNDVELVVVQANVTEWTLSQTLANFRADARTASLPILIYAPDWAAANVEKTVRRFPLTAFALESFTLDHFRAQVEPFLNSLKSEPLTEQERAAQAGASAYWLAHIASTRQTSIFDIAPAEMALDRSIANPDLATNAVGALAAIPTKTAQQRLEGVAVSPTQDAALRELAAVQLAFHIQRHGLLLTGDQVREVEAAIPAAGDPQLASALTSVMGSLKPNAKAVGDQLQQFPIPSPLGP
jgi:hypothetical protein